VRIKNVALFFTATIVLLGVLIGFRAGYHTKLIDSVIVQITSKLKITSSPPVSAQKSSLKIENIILSRLEKLETPRSQVTTEHMLEDSTLIINARIPRGKPMEWVVMQLCSPIGQAGYRVADCMYTEAPLQCAIILRSEKKGHPTVKINIRHARRYFSTSAKMAIVVADFGFKATATTVDFLSFPEPLTVSLVSSRKMSTWTAQIANEYRKEIVILIPMEPLTGSFVQYNNKAVMIHYPPDKIRSILRDATESIPGYAGFANLCGSRVIEDSPVMRTILTELKKDHGYFLINQVSRKSVATSIAREVDVPYRTIDLSLDSAASCGSGLVDTLHHAAMIAQKTGSVVLQGRATAQFITALKSQLPFLQENGIKLVYLSEVVHHPQDFREKD
jgi:polysaccharide deacetylase 2 family uncharacterized protein YibQ